MKHTTINDLSNAEWEAAKQIATAITDKNGDTYYFNAYMQAALDGIKIGLEMAHDLADEMARKYYDET